MDKRRFTNNPIPTKLGDVFGRLTVIGEAEPYGKKHTTRWLVRCECGNEKVVHQSALRQRMVKSCGCVKQAQWKRFVTKHGMSRTPEYHNWAAMKSRCYCPSNIKYADYGGRGITVCDRWKDSFENFLADMGMRPEPNSEIDRKDTNGNYEPNNCQWATRREQNNNRRNTAFVTMNGATMSLADWCRKLGRNYNSVSGRIRQYGWDPIKALTTPPMWKR